VHQENEVKFRINDPEPIRKLLKKLGAENRGKSLERNVCFLGAGVGPEYGNLLRVRKADKITITFKDKIVEGSKYKDRREVEFEVPDFGRAVQLFLDIGLRDYWRYEKERETWLLDGVEIVIDKLPELGYYIEIEGTDKEIEAAARKLGLNIKDGITRTYLDIWEEHKKQAKPCDMVFGGSLPANPSKTKK
jgi:adenylate cyclase class 2